MAMKQLCLPGCQPQPLASYLKALGVFRILVEQRDPEARCGWHTNGFYLLTRLDEHAFIDFFLNEYQPSPIVAPWNGSTGFFPKDQQKQKELLEIFQQSQAARFAPYRQAITVGRQVVAQLGLERQPKEKQKKRLLTCLRNQLPDAALVWLDTCVVIGDALLFAPLTGSGGNDGNLEFSRSFMQRLQEVLDVQTGQPRKNSDMQLRAALFGDVQPKILTKESIGQFSPFAAGGANARPGFMAESRVNPWEYVLAIEGTAWFQPSLTRRYEQTGAGELSYPFMVRPAAVGYGTASPEEKARAELWVPVWKQPVSWPDLQAFFREGRAKVGPRSAQDGVDFARAISRLGVQRRVAAFVRYGFLERNGRSYFAVPLGTFVPKQDPQVDLLADIDGWLVDLKHRLRHAKQPPAAVMAAYRQLESALVELASGKATLEEVLVALGQMELVLSRSSRFSQESGLRPMPLIRRPEWFKAIQQMASPDDVEWHLALALAARPKMRQRLSLVRWVPPEQHRRGYWTWGEGDDGITTWQSPSLSLNLLRLLQREEIERRQQETQKTLDTRESVSLTDPPLAACLDHVAMWIQGQVDEVRLERLLRGLCLLRLPDHPVLDRRPDPDERPPTLPPAYGLLVNVYARQVVLDPQPPNQEPTVIEIPAVPNLLWRLAAGDGLTATQLACSRLQASGVPLGIQEGFYLPPEQSLRLGAALAFPLTRHQRQQLLKPFLQATDTQEK